MFATGENHGEVIIVMTPADDIHHRLCLVFALRKRLIQAAEQLFITILRTAGDQQGWTGILFDKGDTLVVVEADDLLEVAAQSLPSHL